MNCLICLKELPDKTPEMASYHGQCLANMFGSSKVNVTLAESRSDLVTSMPKKNSGFSISGVQMKVQLTITDGALCLVDRGGHFIMKPSPEEYLNVAENEHATLILMRRVGFPVPPCGLVRLKDGHLVFVIRRYDRDAETGAKHQQEDALQAMGIENVDAGQKYTAASYQDVLEMVIDKAGVAVAAELLERIAFSYLVGNDDHHLKNISFLSHPIPTLAPGYDVLASSLYSASALDGPLALAMLSGGEPPYYRTMGNGMYAGVDFLELAKRSGLPETAIKKRLIKLISKVRAHGEPVIRASYMPDALKTDYLDLLNHRLALMDLLTLDDIEPQN